jgi:hypothetical protein
MIRKRPRPYWLSEGTEPCAACFHLHVLETVYWCSGCDRSVCVQCIVVVHETREAFCPECLASTREER